MDEDLIKYVKRSTYRQKILKSLDGEVLIPIEISKRTGIKIHHLSKVLAELKSKDLIEIINPEVRKGRLYRLKEDGKEMVEYLKNLDD